MRNAQGVTVRTRSDRTAGAVKKALKKQAAPRGAACENIYRETADPVERSAVL